MQHVPSQMRFVVAVFGVTLTAVAVATLGLPRVDLNGPVALGAYWIAQSGGVQGMPWIGLAMTALVVVRPGVSWKRAAAEAAVLVLLLMALLGGGAWLNEHVVKPALACPRPNIAELAQEPIDSPALKMSVEEFYALKDKSARGDHLAGVLEAGPRMHDLIRRHWVSETGYSFPSGHSFSAMMLATFFLALGSHYAPARRRWAFYLLVPWAAAVCCSRQILRVHTPADICVGALEGTVAGLAAFLVVRRVFAAGSEG